MLKYLFIHLDALGLSYGTWDLCCCIWTLSRGMQSQLQHACGI